MDEIASELIYILDSKWMDEWMNLFLTISFRMNGWIIVHIATST